MMWYEVFIIHVFYADETVQIFRMTDMIDTNNPPQYLTREEFMYEKHFVSV